MVDCYGLYRYCNCLCGEAGCRNGCWNYGHWSAGLVMGVIMGWVLGLVWELGVE
jgi:hypothetical protein